MGFMGPGCFEATGRLGLLEISLLGIAEQRTTSKNEKK